jgi:plasmid stability protein
VNNQEQMLVRLPSELKAKLKARAAANHRTATGELVAILDRALAADKDGLGG